MRLRKHSGLHHNGRPGWPSSWVKIAGPGEHCITGEPGILNGVTLSRLDPPTACYLEIKIASSVYMGTIDFAQPEFCLRAYEILRTNIGKPISEIGDIDVL